MGRVERHRGRRSWVAPRALWISRRGACFNDARGGAGDAARMACAATALAKGVGADAGGHDASAVAPRATTRPLADIGLSADAGGGRPGSIVGPGADCFCRRGFVEWRSSESANAPCNCDEHFVVLFDRLVLRQHFVASLARNMPARPACRGEIFANAAGLLRADDGRRVAGPV